MGYLSKSPLGGCAGWLIIDSKTEVNIVSVVNLIHSRLTPTRPFSERSPTYKKVAYFYGCSLYDCLLLTKFQIETIITV
ncbi:MAG: hypothetical protein LBK82_12260 [Planctomycetaceae bacterium]|nr:hypothetical protein [Planctomycetaceae bacterium]